ncbi:hypothetical protein ACWEQ8_34060, partial [Streptomyces noursei]
GGTRGGDAGGGELVDTGQFQTGDGVLGHGGAAFAASGARIACVCSSDMVYAEQAAEVTAALKAAGAVRVYLAGKPGAHREEFVAAGVDTFVFVGCDAAGALSSALDVTEVAG